MVVLGLALPTDLDGSVIFVGQFVLRCGRLELCHARLRQQLFFQLEERQLYQEVLVYSFCLHQHALLPHGCMDLLGTNSNSSY